MEIENKPVDAMPEINLPPLLPPPKPRWEDMILKGWRPYAWICLLGFLLYFQILFFDFTYFDDHTLIINNKYYISDITNIITAFKEDVFRRPYGEAYYRPILTISFILDAQLGGTESPFMYHLSNIVMHLAASCLLFWLLIKLSYRRDLSLLFTLLFVTHPLLTQAVAWIPGRNDSLVTIFVLLSLVYFLDFIEKKTLKLYALHIFFFALSIYTKEIILLFPVILIFYMHFVKREKILSISEKVLGLGWAVVIISWFTLRWTALSSPREIPFPSMISSTWESMPAVVTFFGKLFFPFNLSVIPTLQDSPLVYGFITLILVTIVLVKSKGVRLPIIIFGLGWFLIFLVPTFITSHLSGTPYFIEHRIYLPLVGFIMILLETDIIKSINFLKTNTRIICACLLLAFFILTFMHSMAFKNRVKYWENAARTSPSVMIGHGTLAPIYYVEKEYDKALIEYKKMLELEPKHRDAHYWIASIYMGKNMLKEAQEHFEIQIVNNPESDMAHFELGGIYYRAGRLQNAERMWKQALELNPQIPLAHNNLGLIYMNTNKPKEAEEELKKEIMVNPKGDKAYFNLGMLYANIGKTRDAEEAWKKAIQANPDHIESYARLAMMYHSQGNIPALKYCVFQLQKRGVQVPPEIMKDLKE
jgi:Tfp pilus assembly protein PilF